MRDEEAPIRTPNPRDPLEWTETHPSYAMVGLSNTHGDAGPMFGSALPRHNGYVTLRVRTATRQHRHGEDYFSAAGWVKPFTAEFDMPPWAPIPEDQLAKTLAVLRPSSIRCKALADLIREGPIKSIWRTRWQEIRADVPDSPRKALVDTRLLTGEPRHIPRTLSAEALDRLSIWLEGHEAK